METKNEEKRVEFDRKNGITITWDNFGNCFISMSINSIPKHQFDAWMKRCKMEYSGKRWDMILADHIKATAYDAMMAGTGHEIPCEDAEPLNPLGLLNGGI